MTVFIDSNIPMYLIGAQHPHKLDAQRLLETALSAGERLVTDVEVLQEICHRYRAIDRLEAIQPAFDLMLGLVDEVLPIDLATVEKSKDLLLRYRELSSRGSLHIAALESAGIERLMSFDSDFDTYPGVVRVS